MPAVDRNDSILMQSLLNGELDGIASDRSRLYRVGTQLRFSRLIDRIILCVARCLRFPCLKNYIACKTLVILKDFGGRATQEQIAKIAQMRLKTKAKHLITNLLQHYPDVLIAHPELKEICFDYPNKIAEASRRERQDLVALWYRKMKQMRLAGFNRDIRKMYEHFRLRREVLGGEVRELSPATGAIQTRNDIYFVPSQDPSLVVKHIRNKEDLSCEQAASEMAHLGGFGRTMPTMCMGSHPVLPLSDRVRVLFQDYIAGESGADIWLRLLSKVVEGEEEYADLVQKLTRDIHLDTLHLSILNSYVLGDKDGNAGNFLLGRDFFNLDHEKIMPESNERCDKVVPARMQGEVLEATLFDVCPLRCWAAGLPGAAKPFSRKVIRRVLNHLHRKEFEEYHHRRKQFSDKAVAAQLERIDTIRRLFEEEKYKKKTTLTPREVVLSIMEQHGSYKYMKDELDLPPILLFAEMGYVPANIGDEEIQDAVFAHQRAMRNRCVVKRELGTLSKTETEKLNLGAAVAVANKLNGLQGLALLLRQKAGLSSLLR